MNESHVAHCLCGTVTLTAATVSTDVVACHCSTCRQWAGGPLLAVDCGSSVTIDGAASVTRFASSQWAERAFCAICGTHLFCRLLETDQYLVPPGLFRGIDGLRLATEIFIDQKPDFYAFDSDSTQLTAAQVSGQG